MNIFAQTFSDPSFTTTTEVSTSSGPSTSIVLMYLVAMVIIFGSLAKIFMKAGRRWWEAIIPIYNIYVMLKIVGRPGWWLLLLFIPIVNIVVAIVLGIDFAKVFGKGVGFGLGLAFLSIIFYPVLAFSSVKYVGAGATGIQPVNPNPTVPENTGTAVGVTQPGTSSPNSPTQAPSQDVAQAPQSFGADPGQSEPSVSTPQPDVTPPVQSDSNMIAQTPPDQASSFGDSSSSSVSGPDLPADNNQPSSDPIASQPDESSQPQAEPQPEQLAQEQPKPPEDNSPNFG